MPIALIADDEPMLRDALEAVLAKMWPELAIVAKARNGREAVQLFDQLRPDICFLDVHMPGMSGIEAARHIGAQAQLVFVTAYDHYALQAFEHGVLDYLVKPVTEARMATTVRRLKERIGLPNTVAPSDDLLRELARRLQLAGGASITEYLRWLRASNAGVMHLISVQDVDYLRADSKYTLVCHRDDTGQPQEALIRLGLKQLSEQLDPTVFAQVHRGVVVNMHAIRSVIRIDRDSAEIVLKHRPERLPVGKTYLHKFSGM